MVDKIEFTNSYRKFVEKSLWQKKFFGKIW